jgi:hypothetical protein
VLATLTAMPVIRQWIITLACLCAGAGIAATTGHTQQGATACASRDLKLMTTIEEHGAAQDISPEQLAGAAFTMMRARNACRQGHIADAINIYDGVVLAPGLAQSGE